MSNTKFLLVVGIFLCARPGMELENNKYLGVKVHNIRSSKLKEIGSILPKIKSVWPNQIPLIIRQHVHVMEKQLDRVGLLQDEPVPAPT